MAKATDWEAEYTTAKAGDVVRYFVKGFKPPRGREIADWEWWFDPAKGEFVFRIYHKPKAKTT